MFKRFVNVLYKCLRHHSDLQLSCWYLAQGLHLKFLFYGFVDLMWITIMIMMWTSSRELLYCTGMIERAITKPDPTEPESVSATMTFVLMDGYKCEMQPYHSFCGWCSAAISRFNSPTIMVVQRKNAQFLMLIRAMFTRNSLKKNK